MSFDRRIHAYALFLGWFLAMMLLHGCARRPPWDERRLPPSAMLPVNSERPADRSADFADMFCSTLALHASSAGGWGDCSQYLEPAGTIRELPPLAVEPEVVVVPGILGRCVEDRVRTFSRAAERLEAQGVDTDYISVAGFGSAAYNGRQIIEHLRGRLDRDPDATFILVGYSKGAPDAMEALVQDPGLRDHVVALVTVAGALAGSRAVDNLDASMRRLVRRLAPEECMQGDGGAFESLERGVRLRFLREHPRPMVPTYSLVAVSSPGQTSRIHRTTWNQLDAFDADQDGQVLAYDAVAPGAAYLGAARGDHWAVAMPFEHAGDIWRVPVDRNHFPREALLEAIVRFVIDDLGLRSSP